MYRAIIIKERAKNKPNTAIIEFFQENKHIETPCSGSFYFA
ncbi:hypothetical protein SAMD00020551_1165 [Mesobacillus selenatarsenatis SF-1]|uniref:Uncharacterized protein n=1 Tax=Mesobacillus selenatarsenatis (strain DSM 18680 / JCM 14380 / FERM P-15431 / SF-1) TaxID=1321606 RepID=A0A0A8X1A6_MESS1|nr:hypothetical protein SAMD00020551_1165 [Mesobacillus selenatarsenatis SF-1]